MQDVIAMSGYMATHGLYSVYDGDDLIPIVGTLDKTGEQTLKRMMIEDTSQLLPICEAALRENQDDLKGAVYVVDTRMTIENDVEDVLVVKIRLNAEAPAECEIRIVYSHATKSSPFAIKSVFPAKAEGVEAEDLMVGFLLGAHAHPEYKKMWGIGAADEKPAERPKGIFHKLGRFFKRS